MFRAVERAVSSKGNAAHVSAKSQKTKQNSISFPFTRFPVKSEQKSSARVN